jgi:hypothetical protein
MDGPWVKSCMSAVGVEREWLARAQSRMGAKAWARRWPGMHLALGIDVGALLYEALHQCWVVETSRIVDRCQPLRICGTGDRCMCRVALAAPLL